MLSWWRLYQMQRQIKRYHEGFGWAMAAYYIKKIPLDGIGRYINDYSDDFDAGAKFAITVIEQNGGAE